MGATSPPTLRPALPSKWRVCRATCGWRSKPSRLPEASGYSTSPGAVKRTHRIDLRRHPEALFVRPHDLDSEALHRIRAHHVDRAAAETAARQARAINALDGDGRVHQEIQFLAAHFVIVLEAAMRIHEQLAHALHVAALGRVDELLYPIVFSN